MVYTLCRITGRLDELIDNSAHNRERRALFSENIVIAFGAVPPQRSLSSLHRRLHLIICTCSNSSSNCKQKGICRENGVHFKTACCIPYGEYPPISTQQHDFLLHYNNIIKLRYTAVEY